MEHLLAIAKPTLARLFKRLIFISKLIPAKAHRVIASMLVLIIFLNSCATTVVTHGELEPKEIDQNKGCTPEKSITVTAYSRTDFYLDSKVVRTMPYPALENLVLDDLKRSGCFKSINVVAPDAAASWHANSADITGAIHEKNGPVTSQYFLEVYSFSETHGYHGNGLMLPYFIWIAAHLLTLGLLPVWMPSSLELKGLIRDPQFNVISKVEIKNSASEWTWSPLIFSSNAHKMYEAKAKSAFFKNTVDTFVGEMVSKTTSLPLIKSTLE